MKKESIAIPLSEDLSVSYLKNIEAPFTEYYYDRLSESYKCWAFTASGSTTKKELISVNLILKSHEEIALELKLSPKVKLANRWKLCFKDLNRSNVFCKEIDIETKGNGNQNIRFFRENIDDPINFHHLIFLEILQSD